MVGAQGKPMIREIALDTETTGLAGGTNNCTNFGSSNPSSKATSYSPGGSVAMLYAPPAPE